MLTKRSAKVAALVYRYRTQACVAGRRVSKTAGGRWLAPVVVLRPYLLRFSRNVSDSVPFKQPSRSLSSNNFQVNPLCCSLSGAKCFPMMRASFPRSKSAMLKHPTPRVAKQPPASAIASFGTPGIEHRDNAVCRMLRRVPAPVFDLAALAGTRVKRGARSSNPIVEDCENSLGLRYNPLPTLKFNSSSKVMSPDG